MDYSKMSDFDINKRVFSHLTGCKPLGYPHNADGRSVGNETNGHYMWYDYCNNPADAWPIIAKHRISIEFDGDNSTAPQTTWCHTRSLDRSCGIDYQKNPLRAAMITFLLMQE